MTVRMSHKAANTGDQLKHALLLDVLQRVPSFLKISYSETHAGAGIHYVSDQDLEHHYIQQLRERYSRSPLETNPGSPGALYYEWLKYWWRPESRRDSYPGSALMTSAYLARTFPEDGYSLRLTEIDPSSYQSLKDFLQATNVTIRNGSFHENLEWLLEPDPLVLLVDPFIVVPELGQEGMTQGDMDYETIRHLVGMCTARDWVVAGFWWYSKHHLEQTRALFHSCATQAHAEAIREFQGGDHYRMTWIGLGGGAPVVRGLPGSSDWDRSWLKGVISEAT